MYFLYYTFKNDEPNRGYVGMSIHPASSGYKGSGIYLKVVFKKYGIKNFTRIDLFQYTFKDECHYHEGFYIKILKTLKKDGGYNLCPNGGIGLGDTSENIRNHRKGTHHSLETRKKISEKRKLQGSPTTGLHYKKHKKQIAPNKGVKMAQNQKDKISESLKKYFLNKKLKQ